MNLLGIPQARPSRVIEQIVESLIKEVNYRVKGTEKFWDHPEGAGSDLASGGALPSDDDRIGWITSPAARAAVRRHTTREFAQAV